MVSRENARKTKPATQGPRTRTAPKRGAAVARALERQFAVRGRPDQRNRVFLVQLEVDEVGRIEHLERQRLCLDRRFERQREVQRQRRILVLEVVVDRIVELFLLLAARSARLGEGEEGVILERLNVGLRERLQFIAGVDAFRLGLDAFRA